MVSCPHVGDRFVEVRAGLLYMVIWGKSFYVLHPVIVIRGTSFDTWYVPCKGNEGEFFLICRVWAPVIVIRGGHSMHSEKG